LSLFLLRTDQTALIQYITITFYYAASPLYCNPSCCPPAPQLLQLSIQDLPNITIGDYTRIPKVFKENPIVISNTIEVGNEDKGYLYTAQEVEEGIAIKGEDEDEDDITTDSGEESDQQFDYDSESSFHDSVDGDEDEQGVIVAGEGIILSYL
jgi:hypothetical protein